MYEAFVEKVRQEDDDLTRLICADWLEERGSVLSEITRLQIDLSQEWVQNTAQQVGTLMSGLRMQIADQLGVEQVMIRKGFVEIISTKLETWLEKQDEILRLCPLRQLVLRVENPDRVRELQPTKGITGLSFEGNEGNKILWEMFHTSIRFQLISFGLSFTHLSADRLLLFRGWDSPLRSLSLSHNDFGEEGATVLSQLPLLGQLNRLNVSGNGIGAIGSALMVSAAQRRGRFPLLPGMEKPAWVPEDKILVVEV